MQPKKEPYTFDPERFADAVTQLRKYQKLYYQSPKGSHVGMINLMEAKKWEKTVDTWLIFRDQSPKK